jgi:hypothetical protein
MTASSRPIRTRNDSLFEVMQPFLVTPPWNLDAFDHAPLGLPIPPANVYDPTRAGNEVFLHLLQTLDRLTFGPEGMPMPRWVFYDCAEIPGGIFGFGRPAASLPSEVRQALGLADDYDALVPFSMYVAIPVRPPTPDRPGGSWFGHNLASLNPVFPALKMKGRASVTKALALQTFRAAEQIGATQWDSEALFIHTRFGPLDLVTAWTPAHSEPETLTYRFDVTEEKIRAAMGDPDVSLPYPPADFEIAADDHQAMQDLQADIEKGGSYAVVGPPRRHEGVWRVPVAAPR